MYSVGKGDGTFQPIVKYQSASGHGTSVAVSDVNGDGKLDIVTTIQDAGNNGLNEGLVSVRLGNGDGTFQSEQTYSSGGFLTNSVAVADVNGDGRPDLVVANICADNAGSCTRSSVGVLLNNSPEGKNSAHNDFASLQPEPLYLRPESDFYCDCYLRLANHADRKSEVHVGWLYDRLCSAQQQRRGDSDQIQSQCRSYPLTAVYVGDANNLLARPPC